MASKHDDVIIKSHYEKVARKHKLSKSSTMEDEIVRDKEVDFIRDFLSALRKKCGKKKLRVLDLGCGNGYTLSVLSRSGHGDSYWGLDFSGPLLSFAKKRALSNCTFIKGDARSLPFDTGFFDIVYTERCLINILDWNGQKAALGEIGRVMKEGGHYLMIEAFTDGLENNNRARRECGLSDLKAAYHNMYFDKDRLSKAIDGIYQRVEPSEFGGNSGFDFSPNFLSSHYFIARVLHALVTKGAQLKNTEFVKFFSYLPPAGNYSPIQAYILRKAGK